MMSSSWKKSKLSPGFEKHSEAVTQLLSKIDALLLTLSALIFR